MTWRRFLVLLRGLSPQSASVNAAQSRVEFGEKAERVRTVESPDDAQSAFVTLFGGRGPGPAKPPG